MKENITKEQHYVPQMYLKRFTYDGKQCFTMNKKHEVHKAYISDICKKRYLYEIRNEDNTIRNLNLLEKKFFGPIEERSDIILSMLCNMLDAYKHPTIIDWDPADVIDFFASLIVRNIYMIKSIKEMVDGSEVGIDFEQNKNAALLFNLVHLPELNADLKKYYNAIVHVNNTSTPFITSSFPCLLLSATCDMDSGFFYFPISSRYMVVLEPKKLTGNLPCRILFSNEEFVKRINKEMFCNLDKCDLLIANNQNVLYDLIK